MEQVRVNLRGVINARLEELNAFQEDIKVLTEDNYIRMKEEILADGFSFSPHVFVDGDGKLWILDGHQRRSCLSRMQDEGFQIPTIPCMEVEAESLEHARRLVLAAASQYGTFRVNKVMDFVKKSGLEAPKLVERFVLPTVKMDKLTGVSGYVRKAPDGAKEMDPEAFKKFTHHCPKCGFGFD